MSFYLLSDDTDERCVSLKHLNKNGYPTLESIFLLITIEENLYLSSFLKQYGKPYIFCIEKEMNLLLKEAHLIGMYMIDILRDNESAVMHKYNNCRDVTDIIQKICITGGLESSYFQGCDRRLYAAAHFSKLNRVKCVHDVGNFLPTNEVEEYAFRTGFLPCIKSEGNSTKRRLTFMTYGGDPKQLPLWVDCHLFKLPFGPSFIYTDKLLLLLEELHNTCINVMGPPKMCQGITDKSIKGYIVNIIKILCDRYPKKIKRFYPSGKANPDAYETVIIAARHKMCVLYKKHILSGGRNTSLPEYQDFQYLNQEHFDHQLHDTFGKIGITSIMTLDEALAKLKLAKPGYMVKMANLIRRRIIWRRGNNVMMIPSFLRKVPAWWFNNQASVLPAEALTFMYKRILTLLNVYLTPNVVDIIIHNFEKYDLEDVISNVHHHSQKCQELRRIALNTDNASLRSFLMCIFFLHREGTSIQDNYTGWKLIIYSPYAKGCSSQIEMDGMDNYDRKGRLPVKNMFLLKSAKDIQRISAGLYRSHAKRT